MSVKHLYLVAAAAIIACAPASGTSGHPPAIARRANILTADEIRAAKADGVTAYDALARLRSNWLTVHGVSSFDPRSDDYAIVFVDGQLYGGLNSLRNIQADHVAEFRYYNVTEAGATFGLRGGTGGAIDVITKGGR